MVGGIITGSDTPRPEAIRHRRIFLKAAILHNPLNADFINKKHDRLTKVSVNEPERSMHKTQNTTLQASSFARILKTTDTILASLGRAFACPLQS